MDSAVLFAPSQIEIKPRISQRWFRTIESVKLSRGETSRVMLERVARVRDFLERTERPQYTYIRGEKEARDNISDSVRTYPCARPIVL